MTGSPTQENSTTLIADLFHAPERGHVTFLPHAAITFDGDGTILEVGDAAAGPDDAFRLPKGTYLLPGLVDLHVHAPQYPQLGSALDEPLEDWLQTYTFPLEARYEDEDFAREVYGMLIDHMLRCGTTSAVHFGTVHLPATQALAQICLDKGQRALVGKVAMDHQDTCPEYYRDTSAESAVSGTHSLITYIRNLPGNDTGLVQPIITPRFVPSCTDDCLRGLGQLAAQTGVTVQTHVSESDWEHGFVAERMGMSDAETLDHFGLLREHTLLAHANFLSDQDMSLVRERGGGIAHCPWSNAYFAGAVFPLRAALERGLRAGLGTDISGGPIGTVWEAARMSIAASRMLETGVDPSKPACERGAGPARIDVATAFHLATRGGALAAGLETGAFEPGLKFDAIAVNPAAPLGQIAAHRDDTPDRLLEKMLYGATKANIEQVWTDGIRRV